jgi:hypothetical protein
VTALTQASFDMTLSRFVVAAARRGGVAKPVSRP